LAADVLGSIGERADVLAEREPMARAQHKGIGNVAVVRRKRVVMG